MTTSASVTVYTKPGCPPCNATKRHLVKACIPFAEVPISEQDDVMAAIAEFSTAPVVRVVTSSGEEFAFAGYRPDRLNALAG